MGSTKWTYYKEQSFTSNCYIYLKILFQFKNLLQRVDFMYRNVHIFVSAEVLFEGGFSLWVSLKIKVLYLKNIYVGTFVSAI